MYYYQRPPAVKAARFIDSKEHMSMVYAVIDDSDKDVKIVKERYQTKKLYIQEKDREVVVPEGCYLFRECDSHGNPIGGIKVMDEFQFEAEYMDANKVIPS